MEEILEVIIDLIIFFLIIVVYYRAKNRFQEKHPKHCDFCGNMVPGPIALRDGHICTKCQYSRYGNSTVNLDRVLAKKHRSISVGELKDFMNMLENRGQQMKSFTPTRVSTDGRIKADDNLGLFVVTSERGDWAHRISDIKRFKLVIDRDWDDASVEEVSIDGGHIAIYLDELEDELDIEVNINTKLIGGKHEVKKLLEPDLKFLEEITGMKRG